MNSPAQENRIRLLLAEFKVMQSRRDQLLSAMNYFAANHFEVGKSRVSVSGMVSVFHRVCQQVARTKMRLRALGVSVPD